MNPLGSRSKMSCLQDIIFIGQSWNNMDYFVVYVFNIVILYSTAYLNIKIE